MIGPMRSKHEQETVVGAVDPNLGGSHARPSSVLHREDDAAAAPWNPPGERYGILRPLGRGGMASVHLASDSVLLREVAIKRIDPPNGFAPDPERFVGEAQITAQLDHPNIPPVHDLVLEGDAPYFVMKAVSGQTFADYLDARPEVPRDAEVLDDLLVIFLKVCDAIAFAHSRGVVHRDLKPQNVMVDTFGRVYVMDWGLARVLPGSQAERVRVARRGFADDGSGTVSYMAPEQAQPLWRPIGPWTDVFALGALLYEIVSGHPPYYGESHAEVRKLAAQADIVPLENIVPGGHVPAALSRIVKKATEREPTQRYAGVSQLARDVERFRRGGLGFGSRRYEVGETVVREGDHGNDAYVITHGRCVAYKTVDGKRVVLREMGPGDVFGEMAVFSSRPRSATVEALEPTVVRVVGRHMLQEGLGLDTWMGAFVRALTDRFREVEEKLERLERSRPASD